MGWGNIVFVVLDRLLFLALVLCAHNLFEILIILSERRTLGHAPCGFGASMLCGLRKKAYFC